MNKLLKYVVFVFAVGFVINIIFSVGMFAYMASKTLPVSMETADISVFDLLKPHLDTEKKAILENEIRKRSIQMGKETAKNIMNSFSVSLTGNNANFTNIDNPKELPSVEAVISQNNENAQLGINRGLEILSQSENMYQEIRNRTLSTNNK